MRPIWKGQISFGLINIPIELYSAEISKDISFKLLDSRNKAKVRYERVNEETGEEVPWNEIVKAYEYSKNNYVVMEEADFKQAAIENTQTFDIEDFIDQKSIDCTYFLKPYYLVPAKNAQKGYVLLREVLRQGEKVAVGKVIIRTKQYLAALIPHDDILILNLLRFAHEIKSADDLNIPIGDMKKYKITEKEFDMAQKLVDSMTVNWEPEKYHDDYHEALMSWIEKKAKSGQLPLPAKHASHKGEGAEIVDFMELLKKSLKKKPSEKKTNTTRANRRQAGGQLSARRKGKK